MLSADLLEVEPAIGQSIPCVEEAIVVDVDLDRQRTALQYSQAQIVTAVATGTVPSDETVVDLQTGREDLLATGVTSADEPALSLTLVMGTLDLQAREPLAGDPVDGGLIDSQQNEGAKNLPEESGSNLGVALVLGVGSSEENDVPPMGEDAGSECVESCQTPLIIEQLTETLRVPHGPPGADGLLASLDDVQLEYLLSGEPSATASDAIIPLDDADLTSILDEAIHRWTASGLTSAAEVFNGISLVITDLPIGVLGQTEADVISIDVTADGHGWFVDPTPVDDSEFVLGDDGRLTARADGPAAGRMDLLTVVLHELGHVAGLSHTDVLTGDSPDVMGCFVDSGTRRLVNATADPFEPGFVPDAAAFLLADGANLNDVIDALLSSFDTVNPPAGEVVFTSSAGEIPNIITVGTTIGIGIADLRLQDVTLTFSDLAYDDSWTGQVDVEATSATLFPGLLDIGVTDDDDLDSLAVDGIIHLAAGNPSSFLNLDDLNVLEDVEKLGWPGFLDVVITGLKLTFSDFRTDDNLNSLYLSVELDGFDTGNDTINDLLDADNAFFELNLQGFASVELAIKEIEDAARAAGSGDFIAAMKAALAAAMASSLTGLGGSVSGKLFGVGSLTATFIYNTVKYDPDGTSGLEPERSAVYIAIEGALSLGPAISGDDDNGGFASFDIAFAISERGPLQYFASIDVPIVLEPVTGLAISSMRLGARFYTTIEGLQKWNEDDDSYVTGATVQDDLRHDPGGPDHWHLVTVTLDREHDLVVGDEVRILEAGTGDYNGDFTVLTVNGNEVTYRQQYDPGGFTGNAKIMRLTIREPLDLLDEGLNSGTAPPDDIFEWRDTLDQQVLEQLEEPTVVGSWLSFLEEVVLGGGASLSFDPRIPDWLLSFDVDFLLGLGLDFDEPVLQILLNGKMSLLDGLVTFNNTRLYADLSDLFSGAGKFLYLQTQGETPFTDPLLVYRGAVSFEVLGGSLAGSEVLNAWVTDTTMDGYWTVELELALDDPSNEYSIGDSAAVFDSNPNTLFDGVYEVIHVEDTANTITIKVNCDLDGNGECSEEEINATNPGTWEWDGSARVSNKHDLGIGFGITVAGGVDLNIPYVTTLTVEGTVTVEFWVPDESAEEDFRIALSFDADLSETHVGAIATAEGMFVVAVDVGDILNLDDDGIVIYGAARLTTELDFLEHIGLYMDVDGFVRINSSGQDRSIELPASALEVDLPKNSFALRLDGAVDFRIDFNSDRTFAVSESVFLIEGIFVLEFSAEQGFNVALFREVDGLIKPAALRLGPAGQSFIEFGVRGFLMIRSDGIAADLVLTADADLPLGLANMSGAAVLIVNTMGRDVTFEIPGGLDESRPHDLSVTIPGAAPANPSAILDDPRPGAPTGLSLDDLIGGDTSWATQSTPGAYGIVFVNGDLELLGVLNLEVSGYVLLSSEVMSLELKFYTGVNFFNLAQASAYGSVFFSSEGEFELEVWGHVQLGPGGFNITGDAHLSISYLDKNGKESGGTGDKSLDVSGNLSVSVTIFWINLGSVNLDISYNSGSGAIYATASVKILFWWKRWTFGLGALKVGPPPLPIKLGQVDDGVLTLNVGPAAGTRNLLVEEVNEDVLIERLSGNSVDGEQIRITMFGHSQVFDNVHTIAIPDMGAGEDYVVIYEGVTIPVEVHFGEGDDILISDGSGIVTAYGDGGADRLEGGSANDQLFGGAGDDILVGKAGQDSLWGGDGADILVGDLASAELTADQTAYVLQTTGLASGGDDTIAGGDGADVIFGGSGNDVIKGGAGEDVLIGDDGTATVSQTQEVTFTLTVLDFSGNDIIDGGADNDELFGQKGADILLGGEGADLLYGDGATFGTETSRNILLGDGGTITIVDGWVTKIDTTGETAGGADTIYGNGGADVVMGGVAADTIYGDAGDDVLLGDTGVIGLENGSPIHVDTGDEAVAAATVQGDTGDDIIAGGADTIYGDGGADIVMGGAAGDTIHGGAGIDLIFGDQGEITSSGGVNSVVTNSSGTAPWFEGYTFTATRTSDDLAGAADLIYGDAEGDYILGQQGADVIFGGAGDDDIYGGHNVAGGHDAGDIIDGGTGHDVIAGDNASIQRVVNTVSPRFRALQGTLMYGTAPDNDGWALVTATAQANPDGIQARTVILFDSSHTPDSGTFGSDLVAGGADDDLIFGQLGEDVLHGDGQITTNVGSGYAVSALITTDTGSDVGGDDYVEGNGGNDTIYGGLGQDDLIGGNSTMFGLGTPDERPDGSDTIFGGNGDQLERNNLGDGSHTTDADAIVGDNGDIYRLVGTNGVGSGLYLTFHYDNYGETRRLIPRAVQLLDYTPGGPDYDPAACDDTGAADEIHGESGDDLIYGMVGNDVLFGESQDDDIIGGGGNDWISGGTDDDGVLGDDGRIYTSRNELAEPLYGIGDLADELNQDIRTPGSIQQATINVAGELKKTMHLTPFSVDPLWSAMADEFDGIPILSHNSDDIIYGGWGNDWLHGGSGDDAMSGAEALPELYAYATNPGDVLCYGHAKAGEFAAYDEFEPLKKIVGFLLNFDAKEGSKVDSVNGKDIFSDGNDRIFGDLGNDWLVGGTGRDSLYGGWGDDLLNADDDHDSTNDGVDPLTEADLANNVPDIHPTYEDRAYGGAGRDVLIGNTVGDRLIDWVGGFDSFIVPFDPTDTGTISRTVQPQLSEFLCALSAADGADPTRPADIGASADPARNGEPFGELGMVRQHDFAWQTQTGAPDDLQGGSIPGGPRDVLCSATFDDGSMSGFFTDTGIWEVTDGVLRARPALLGGAAVSLFNVADALPSYFELQASVMAVKPTSGWKANSYLIFDYQSADDFKFAGLDVSMNKLVMGHRDGGGWHVDEQAPFPGGVKSDKYYNVLLAVNGVNVTLIVNNKQIFTHTYQPRVLDGYSYGLNSGMVGVGSDNSRGAFDNLRVQVLPPQVTFDQTEDFSDGLANLFTGYQNGDWSVSAGRYNVTPNGAIGMSLLDIGPDHLSVSSYLELSATINTAGRAGFVLDRYDDGSFKFAVIDAVADQVVIGHYTQTSGWVNDAVVSKMVDAGTDYTLGVALKGSMVSVTLDDQLVLGYTFNAASVDGNFGLLATGGDASFDDVRVKTNDPAFGL